MISTKYRKEQKARAKQIVAAKRASKDPTKKDKVKGNKKDHKVRMARRNERIKQFGLFRIAERKRQIEKLKAIIEENKRKQLEESQEPQNEIGEVYDGLLELGNTPLQEVEPEERHIGPGFYEFINEGGSTELVEDLTKLIEGE